MPHWVRSKHVGQWLLLMLVVVVLHSSDLRLPAPDLHPTHSIQHRPHRMPAPQLAIVPYVRPTLAARMVSLQPTIQAAAAHYYDPTVCELDQASFARLIAVIIDNEQNVWFEDMVEPVRPLRPAYEYTQVLLNRHVAGSNYSVWPTNLRPSVALEVVRGEVPIPHAPGIMTTTLRVARSQIHPADFSNMDHLYAALNEEISDAPVAIEYLAANLVRGCYRARYEGVPQSWRTLAAWHNRGIVQPTQISQSGWTQDYLRRAGAYIPTAHTLLNADVQPQPSASECCR